MTLSLKKDTDKNACIFFDIMDNMTQDQALTILKTGANVFLTGEPGAGKTYVLNQYIEHLKDHAVTVAVTASTGIAATHIGGVTIHSWSGVGIKKNISAQELDEMEQKKYLWKRFDKTEVLIIDEISMLDAGVLDSVDSICKTFKRNPAPFGGMQVVLVGDFFQLPPIARGEEVAKFAFEGRAWKETKPLTLYLSEQHRQDDETLLGVLSAIRKGDVDQEFTALHDRLNYELEDVVRATKLYTHNADVDKINFEELDKLEEEMMVYEMSSRGAAKNTTRLKDSCLSPETLCLKEGAIVMCTKNNFDAGYVNGTIGEITGHDKDTGHPVIITNEGQEITIAPDTWAISDGEKMIAEITQIPLRLAWAITVHKSQGMSLDAAEIDLSKAFEYGQGYVALSRVRSLDGLKLLGFNPQALMVHPKILEADKRFKTNSDIVAEYLDSKDEDDLEEKHKEFILSKDGVLEKVDRSKESNIDPKISTFEKTRRLLVEGKNINEIAEDRGITKETVVGHVEKLLEEGKVLFDDILYLKPSSKKFKDALETFQNHFVETGETHLSPVKGKLDDSHSYYDIRLARLFLEK